MIDQKRLRELVKLMKDNDLTELDLQDDTERVALKRAGPNTVASYVPLATPHALSSIVTGALPESSVGNSPSTDETTDTALESITSPMVGTFYAAISPDSDPFVRVSDHVETDTVVCIIEAMKVFNEIKAETTGRIDKVLVDNGQAVEFGQPLFQIKTQ